MAAKMQSVAPEYYKVGNNPKMVIKRITVGPDDEADLQTPPLLLAVRRVWSADTR